MVAHRRSNARWARGGVARIVAACLSLAPTACSEPGESTDGQGCDAVFWGRPQRPGEPLAVRGSWDDWDADVAMQPFASDSPWQFARLALPPGEYGYLVVEEGRARVDTTNGLTTFRAPTAGSTQEVSLQIVEDCGRPRLQVVMLDRVDARTVDFAVQFDRARSEAPMSVSSFEAVGGDVAATIVDADAAADTAVVRIGSPIRGKHRVALRIADTEGVHSPSQTVVMWTDPVAPRWDDGLVYQVVIDRFADDRGAALADPPTPGSRAGGSLWGVTAALERGDFAALGVSALWLSPVYVNPEQARKGRDDDHLYEGYHGYWPVQSRAVEPRIGGEAALDALVAAAHGEGIAVLLDLVPNHLYEDNPRVAEGRAQGWFHDHDPPCVCGTPACPWSQFIQTCWFTDYLPDLRLEHPEVMAMVVDDARWWHERFDTDGFRIDAVPMMPRAATRRIAHAVRQATAPRDAAFVIGEIFTGGGTSGVADLRYHLGPDGLDSAFHFPLMWALRDAVAHGGSFAGVQAVLDDTDVQLAGSGAEQRMGTMIGNHDVTRFASEVQGDAGDDPWASPPPQPTDPQVYERQLLALGLVLTLPGVPVLYYGDEIGLAGAADPDNRRVMPAPEMLSSAQQTLRARIETLGELRRCLPALRSGTRQTLVAEPNAFAFVRDAGDGAPVLVVASNSDAAIDVALPTAGLGTGAFVDVLEGAPLAPSGGAVTIAMQPRQLAVFIPAAHPCLPR